jgi:FkbM family methyltransferase
MKTAHKILLAKLAYHSIAPVRKLFGKSDTVDGTFDGLNYRLDLSEGIDLAIYLQGKFEPTTAAALSRLVKPGTTVLDIGANIGAHTLRLARLVGEAGRVLAFEPTNYAFQKLLVNLSLNQDLRSRVTAIMAFLGSTSSTTAPDLIYSSWPLTRAENLHDKHLGAAMTTEGTPTRRLDDVMAEQNVLKVDFVKLDVDGFECEVLAGATEMMTKDKPVFVMELAPYVLQERGASLDQLLSHFLPLGYRFYTEKDERPLPTEPKALSDLVPVGGSINVVARA